MKRKTILSFFLIMIVIEICAHSGEKPEPACQDSKNPPDVSVADPVSKMTPEEKVSQMMHNSPGSRINKSGSAMAPVSEFHIR